MTDQEAAREIVTAAKELIGGSLNAKTLRDAEKKVKQLRYEWHEEQGGLDGYMEEIETSLDSMARTVEDGDDWKENGETAMQALKEEVYAMSFSAHGAKGTAKFSIHLADEIAKIAKGLGL